MAMLKIAQERVRAYFQTISLDMSFINHQARINNNTALIGTLVLIGIDLYLFKIGLSWTPLHYESLAPLLVVNCNQERTQIFSTIASALLFGVIALLYFAFGLTYQLVSESRIFMTVAPIAVLIYIFPLFKRIFISRQVPIFFLLAACALLITDKIFSRDMLSSAYLPHFFKLSAKSYSTPSSNPVYKRLKKQLSSGHGGILIVFESLGIPKDRSVLTDLVQEYPEFDISTMMHEGGSTIPGEVRYLCGVNGNVKEFSLCLPKQIPSRAMHGNTLQYFNRHIFYHDMGFKKMSGRYELAELETCDYSYLAVCDRALFQKLLQEVHETQCHEFHYLLTIDSHFPFPKYSDHIKGLYGDLRELLEIMKPITKEYPNCQIVIAGDHPPPLSGNFDSKQILLITSH